MLNTKLIRKINKNDEWQTLKYAILPLIKYLKPNSTILCPFDKNESNFVKVFKEYNFNVIYRHIDLNQDFFDLDQNFIIENKVDYIISNPPFSIRKQIIIKLLELNVAFAMLLPLVSIALQPFKNNIEHIQLLIFNKRIKFKNNDNLICKNPPSETAYICKNILPKQIVYEIIENTKNNE